jgi:virginiamycin B lyase
MWFTGSTTNRIGRITADGTVSAFDGTAAGVSEPGAITPGPDGALWFTNINNRIGRITLDGTITTYDTDNAEVRAPFGITLGPDGNVWFTSPANDRIGFVRLPFADAGDAPDAQVPEYQPFPWELVPELDPEWFPPVVIPRPGALQLITRVRAARCRP